MKRMDKGIGAGPAGKRPVRMRKPLEIPDLPDPMEGIELDEDDPGQQAEVTMSAALKGLAERRKGEADSMALTTDGRFYCVLIFDFFDQKMAFLNGVGIKDGDIYIDGRQLADRMGIQIPETQTKMPGLFRVDKKYEAMTLTPAESKAELAQKKASAEASKPKPAAKPKPAPKAKGAAKKR